MVSREQMIEKLIDLHPEWNPQTIHNWKNNQLRAIYNKELQKLVKEIRISLGLSG